MRSSRFHTRLFLIVVLLVHGIVYEPLNGQPADTPRQQGVKFQGLTKTLTSLLNARPSSSIFLGAHEISLEKLVDDNIAAVFDCDSVIGDYLTKAGEDATYEMLAYEMTKTIESRFVYDDGFLYVNILPEAAGDSMHFNISVSRGLEVSVPVIFDASDSSFATAFDTTCTLEFNADIDLFVDTGLALKDSASRATSIRINTLTVELYSTPWDDFEYHECFDCDWDEIDYKAMSEDTVRLFPFIIDRRLYNAAHRCFILYAKSFWYLNPADSPVFTEDEEPNPTLSFEQIENGNFAWEEAQLSTLESVIVMLPADEKRDSLPVSENRAIFQYAVDDLFDSESLEQIWLYSDIHIDENVTLRKRK